MSEYPEPDETGEAQSPRQPESEATVPQADAPQEQGEEGADGAPPEPVDPLAAAEAEVSRLKDNLLRTAADFENFRKRSKRDVEDAARRAREQVLGEMLPIIDNLERAVGAARDATEIGAVVEGVNMVLKSFEDVAGRLELERVGAVGSKFDPNLHDAIQQQETPDVEPGTIVTEVVPGYVLRGRLLRPAMVVVAKAPS